MKPRAARARSRPPIERWWPALAAAAVAAVIAMGYAHTLGYGFHFDDFSNLRDNAALAPPPDLGAIWRFRPPRFVLYLSFALNRLVTGPDPAGLRAVNLLIHLACALLVGWIGARLATALERRPDPRRVGLIAALLFAAHPLASQAFTYLIQRTASLAACFELAAVALYLRARDGGARRDLALSWGCGVLAAFTKEMAAALPLEILLIELALRRARPRAPAPGYRALLPYLAAPLIIAVTTPLPTAKLPHGITAMRETAEIPRATYLMTQLVVVPRYLMLVVWPRGQSLDPAVTLRSAFDGAVLAGFLLLVALTVGALALWRRSPLVTVGWLWFLVTIAPESSLVPIRDVMVEHRLYLPLAGLAWAAAAPLAAFAARGTRHWLVPAALVVVLAVVTHQRNRVWRDEVTLWADVIARAPAEPRGYNNYGMALEGDGRVGEAEAAYRRAIGLDSSYVYGLVNLGRLLAMQGRFRDGLEVLLHAERLAPDGVEVQNDLGNTWLALGDTARAAAAYRHALVADPGAREPAANLARLRGAARP